MGLVALAPELSVGVEERIGRDWLRRPWNYPSGDRAGCVCGGWRVRPLWIRLPRVTLRRPPELTVGADGDAVDWNAPRGVTYGRRGGI